MKLQSLPGPIPSAGSMPGKLKLAHPALIALFLGLAAIAIYWPVVGFDFTNYDDSEYFSENRHVLAGLNWESLKWALRTTDNASWYPVTWLSFLLDATLFGKGPRGPHLVNLLLHAANVALLFLLWRRLTGAKWKSALVAGLFALHPLQVEVVAWISERKGLLSAFFGLLSLWAYGRYVGSPKSEVRSPKFKAQSPESEPRPHVSRFTFHASRFTSHVSPFYLLSLCLFALGLMSKPILVTLPFAMLLLDYWPLQRMENAECRMQNGGPPATLYARRSTLLRLLGEKVPFFGVAVLSAAVTVWVHKEAGAIQPLALLSWKGWLENAVVSYARYVGKALWPTGLALPYPHPGRWPLEVVLAAAGVIVGASLVALWLGRRHAYVFTGWFWFLVTLLPVIGLIQWGGQAMADRFMYIPSIGLFTIVAWAAGELVGGGQSLKWWVPTVFLVVLGACAFQARQQVQYWQDSERLFSHAVTATRNNVVAHNSLGFHYVARGQPEKAERSFQAALSIQPNRYSWHGLGSALIDQRKYAEAVVACEAALKEDPRMAKAHSTLGVALTRLGQTNDAMSHYLEALRLQPELAVAHYNLANALAAQGRIREARQHFEASLRSDPGFGRCPQ